MLRMPFHQCIAPLVVGLIGWTLLKRKWGQPEAVVGGLLLGGLGMWLTYLTLYVLNWVGDKLLVLAADIATSVAGASTVQAALTGAWLATTRLLMFQIVLLVVFIALFGLRVGWAGAVAATRDPVPLSDGSVSTTAAVRGWLLWLAPLVFTWPIAPLFGAALGMSLAEGGDPMFYVQYYVSRFPVVMGVLASEGGLVLGVWSVAQRRSQA